MMSVSLRLRSNSLDNFAILIWKVNSPQTYMIQSRDTANARLVRLSSLRDWIMSLSDMTTTFVIYVKTKMFSK